MRVSAWAAGVLAIGWLATGASVFYGEGHPPLWFVLMEGVVMISFVVAPIGAGAAAIAIWRGRRRDGGTPRSSVALLSVNLFFLLVAIGVCLWLLSIS
jgi:hypothetical protein